MYATFVKKNTMKRRFAFFSFLIMLFSSLFFVAGCNQSQAIEGIHMESKEVIDVPYGNFSYEGINVIVDFIVDIQSSQCLSSGIPGVIITGSEAEQGMC